MKLKFLVLIFYSTISQTEALAFEKCLHTELGFNCVEYISNYDADTITVNIPNTHPLLGKNAKIRVNGIDTPEIRTKDKCEKKAGYIAKDFVTRKLKNAKRIDLKNVKRGKYFRIVADVYIDGEILSNKIISRNLASIYDGGTKTKVDWCKKLRLMKP